MRDNKPTDRLSELIWQGSWAISTRARRPQRTGGCFAPWQFCRPQGARITVDQSAQKSIGRMREPLFAKLISLPRWVKRVIVAVTDYRLLFVALWLATHCATAVVRAEPGAVAADAAAPAIALPVFQGFGIYSVVVRFVTERRCGPSSRRWS